MMLTAFVRIRNTSLHPTVKRYTMSKAFPVFTCLNLMHNYNMPQWYDVPLLKSTGYRFISF